MDDTVTIEYRGISRAMVVGTSVVVESCEAGVLRLRLAQAAQVAAPAPDEKDNEGSADAST